MAKRVDCSHSIVQSIWNASNLKPHLLRTFKLSNAPNFVEKVRDVTSLYTDPPPNSIVVCVDEKTQIQALERPQYSPFPSPGHPAGHARDYKRNGTTSLFAALEVHSGIVPGICMERHTSQDFVHFLDQLVDELPKDREIHLIMDNYATRKTTLVKEWLSNHPRFHFLFPPTSSSWLNLVERWFQELADKCVRRGSFNSVEDLVNKIYSFI